MNLKSIIKLFTLLGERSDDVLWICDAMYFKQIYVSPAFEKIWQRRTDMLYQDMATWSTTLIDEDYDRALREIFQRHQRQIGHSDDKTSFFRIHRPDGTMAWIKDTCFEIYDNEGNVIAIAGVGEAIDPELWHEAIYNQHNIDTLSHTLSNIKTMMNDTKGSNLLLYPQHHFFCRLCQDNTMRNIELTEREADCLYYLLQGKTNEQIAKFLFRSPRTIEHHIVTLRNKTYSSNKFEMVSKIDVKHFLVFYQRMKEKGKK